MKIIQENQLEREVECLKCHSILAISRKDLKVTIFDNVYLYCPVCNNKAYLSDEQREYFKI